MFWFVVLPIMAKQTDFRAKNMSCYFALTWKIKEILKLLFGLFTCFLLFCRCMTKQEILDLIFGLLSTCLLSFRRCMAKHEILDLIFGLLSTCFLLFWRCMANQFPVFPSHYRQFA